MLNLSKIKHRPLYCYFILIVLCFAACDIPVTDILVNKVLNNLEPTTYVRDPSRDIKLQVPDHLIHIPSLWYPCPEGVSRCSPRVDRFTDTSITLSSGGMAMTEDRIYVPDGAGLNIYAFNHNGEFMEDETMSRKPLGASGDRVSAEGTSSDICYRIVTNGTFIYLKIRYTPFRGLMNAEAIVSFDIASKSFMRLANMGDIIYGLKTLSFATEDHVYLTQSQPDLLTAHDKYFIEPQPEYDIKLQHDYEGPRPVPTETWVDGSLSKASRYAMTLTSQLFYDHDHQLIYRRAANQNWGAFHINGEYAGIEFVSERWHRSPHYMNNRIYFIERPREEGVKGEYYIRCYSAGKGSS